MILPHDADNDNLPPDNKWFALFVLVCVISIFLYLLYGQ